MSIRNDITRLQKLSEFYELKDEFTASLRSFVNASLTVHAMTMGFQNYFDPAVTESLGLETLSPDVLQERVKNSWMILKDYFEKVQEKSHAFRSYLTTSNRETREELVAWLAWITAFKPTAFKKSLREEKLNVTSAKIFNYLESMIGTMQADQKHNLNERNKRYSTAGLSRLGYSVSAGNVVKTNTCISPDVTVASYLMDNGLGWSLPKIKASTESLCNLMVYQEELYTDIDDYQRNESKEAERIIVSSSWQSTEQKVLNVHSMMKDVAEKLGLLYNTAVVSQSYIDSMALQLCSIYNTLHSNVIEN